MKIVLKFKIIHYYICYIVGLFYIELLYWRDRMKGGGGGVGGGWGRFRLVIIYVNIYALLLYYDRH